MNIIETMKKIWSISLAICIVLTITGCASSIKASSSVANSASQNDVIQKFRGWPTYEEFVETYNSYYPDDAIKESQINTYRNAVGYATEITVESIVLEFNTNAEGNDLYKITFQIPKNKNNKTIFLKESKKIIKSLFLFDDNTVNKLFKEMQESGDSKLESNLNSGLNGDHTFSFEYDNDRNRYEIFIFPSVY